MSTRIYGQLRKVDVEKRTVYGVLASETPDRSGEVFDFETSRPYFEQWSAGISKTTGGKSLGAVREMHQDSAVGKLTNIVFNDAEKTIEVEAKIVDDSAWEKILEGVYTGFSQGGRYVKRWRDAVTNLMRFTSDPREVSLVDLPCLPDATFEVVKAGGATELRKFRLPTDPFDPELDELAARLLFADADLTVDDAMAEARKQLRSGDHVKVAIEADALKGELNISPEPIARESEVMAKARAEVDAKYAHIDAMFQEALSTVKSIRAANDAWFAKYNRSVNMAKCGTIADTDGFTRLGPDGAMRYSVPKTDRADEIATAALKIAASAAEGDEERALELMKAALQNPIDFQKAMKTKEDEQ